MSPETEPKHAKLTRFLCQELLYEYASGTLDHRRHRDVEEHLPTCRDSQKELENLRKGLLYARDIGAIQVSASLRSALEQFEPAWKKRLRVWTLWSSQRGWRMLPYVFLLGAAALGVYVTSPWTRDMQKEVVLAAQDREAITVPDAASPAVPVTVDLTASAPARPSLEVPVQIAPVEKSSGGGPGQFTRAELETARFSEAWPAVREKILSLDGEAAGNVELGWMRQEGQSYFHFSLPESKWSEFEEFLKSFGPVRFVKERHSRVMPEGRIRIILNVKDGARHEGEAEAP